jgi:hypothetical protein
MVLENNITLLKRKLNEKCNADKTFLQRAICVLELPFVVEEEEVNGFFKKCDGGVKYVEITRSGALVFSAAFVEFNKPKGKKKAVEMAWHFVEEFDVIVVSAEEFLEDQIPTREELLASAKDKGKKGCKTQ